MTNDEIIEQIKALMLQYAVSDDEREHIQRYWGNHGRGWTTSLEEATEQLQTLCLEYNVAFGKTEEDIEWEASYGHMTEEELREHAATIRSIPPYTGTDDN